MSNLIAVTDKRYCSIHRVYPKIWSLGSCL